MATVAFFIQPATQKKRPAVACGVCSASACRTLTSYVNLQTSGKAMLTVIRTPGKKTLTFDRINTVRQLLNKLDETVNSVLVIRGGPASEGGELLTPDRHTIPGETLEVRSVRSKG